MLIDPTFKTIDPSLGVILVLLSNEEDIHPKKLMTGVYEISHFNFEAFLNDDFEMYTQGVCDNLKQVLEFHKEDIEKNYVCISLVKVEKYEQPEEGGWRWHKWGRYIGKHKPKYEYLYDEEGIDCVYCYKIMRSKTQVKHVS